MAVEHLQGGVKVGRFVIVRMIREDDAGVTYLGEYRTRIGQLTHCIIREFFPAGFAERSGKTVIPSADTKKKHKFQRGFQHFADIYAVMARIQDDSIASLIDLVEDNGTRYMVSEYTSDESIGELIAGSGQLRDTFVLSFLSMFLPAMDILEDLGVVNTRLSPDNIHRRVDGIPVLTHFAESIVEGVAVVEPEEGLRDTPYLAPEVGEDDVDHRADIYSLGAIAVHALTGRVPVSALTRLRHIEAGKPDPMNVRTWLRGATENQALVSSLEAALSLTPAMRPSSFEAWRTMLFRPAVAGAASIGALIGRVLSSSAARYAAVGLVGLLFIGAIAALTRSGPNETEVAQAPAKLADRPSVTADVSAPSQDASSAMVVSPEPDAAAEPVLDARERDARREWLAINRDDPVLVGAFLRDFGDTELGESARERLQSLDAAFWAEAADIDTIDGYDAYLATFGEDGLTSGAFVDQAEARIASIAGERRALETDIRSGLIALGYSIEADATSADADFVSAVRDFRRYADLQATPELTTDLLSAIEATVREQAAARAATLPDHSDDNPVQPAPDAEDEVLDREVRVASVETQAEIIDQDLTALLSNRNPVEEALATVPSPDVLVDEPLSSEDVPERHTLVNNVKTNDVTSAAASGAIGTMEVDRTPERVRPAEPDAILRTGVGDRAPARTAQATTATRRAAEPDIGDVFTDCLTCPEMKVLAPGQFRMGSRKSETGRSDNEGPLRDISIDRPFAMGTREITVGEFSVFLAATGHAPVDNCYGETPPGSGDWRARAGFGPLAPGFEQTDRHPVTCVRYLDAIAYVDWLSSTTGTSYRLPTEAEWEYAARAGTRQSRPWRGPDDQLCTHANGADDTAQQARPNWLTHTCDDGRLFTAAVGSYRANRFGLYDMIGNVWEWVEDCYTDNLDSTPGDGAALVFDGCTNRVIRGGSWASSDVQLRSAKRSGDRPDRAYDILGFRVVREVQTN